MEANGVNSLPSSRRGWPWRYAATARSRPTLPNTMLPWLRLLPPATTTRSRYGVGDLIPRVPEIDA